MSDADLASVEFLIMYLDILMTDRCSGYPPDVAARMLAGSSDSPALRELGGMSRSAYDRDVVDLLRRAGAELGFPSLRGTANRDLFSQLLIELINRGAVSPIEAARRIWLEAWDLTSPDVEESLRLIVALAPAWEEAPHEQGKLSQRIVTEAHRLSPRSD